MDFRFFSQKKLNFSDSYNIISCKQRSGTNILWGDSNLCVSCRINNLNTNLSCKYNLSYLGSCSHTSHSTRGILEISSFKEESKAHRAIPSIFSLCIGFYMRHCFFVVVVFKKVLTTFKYLTSLFTTGIYFLRTCFLWTL